MTIRYNSSAPEPSISVCPHCGQTMLIRYGVRFPPKQAQILDLIIQVSKRGGNGGIGRVTAECLASVFYSGVPKRQAISRVISHIHQINTILGETEFRINGIRGEGYRLDRA